MSNDTESQPRRIDAERALDLLQEAVAERGDGYVYQEEICTYVIGQEPSCLVGLALVKGGVSPLALVQLSAVNAKTLPVYIPAVTRRAGEIFQVAQEVQDRHSPWGDALIAAKNDFALFPDEQS